jgi:hypothetical protein
MIALRLEVGSMGANAAGAIKGGTFVPVETEPAEAIEDGQQRLGLVAIRISIIDAKDELPTLAPGEEPVEQRRSDATDMEVTRRAGSKASADGHSVVVS